MIVETGEASGGTGPAKCEVERADLLEPGGAIRPLPADQWVFEQGEQGNGGELFGSGGGEAEEQRAGCSLR